MIDFLGLLHEICSHGRFSPKAYGRKKDHSGNTSGWRSWSAESLVPILVNLARLGSKAKESIQISSTLEDGRMM